MSSTVKMPQLGESVTEGTIGRWLKNEGDFVAKEEPLVEIITDKVTAEMPSPFEGVIQRILIPEGQTVSVGTELVVLESRGETAASPQREVAGVAAVSRDEAVEQAMQEATAVVELAHQRSSPLVRRLAQEHGVDIGQIQGTGLGGRVTKDDILGFVAQRKAAPQAPPAQTPLAAAATAPPPPTSPPAVEAKPSPPSVTAQQPTQLREGEQIVEPGTIRKMIAEHMVRSKRTAPHATTMVEVDMTRVVRWREGVKEEFKRREGIDLTYVPFVVKATVEALKELPTMNASWIDDKIILKRQINIGIAVAADDGLIVPVIHNADYLSIAGLANSVNDLASRARQRKLAPNDVQGGTFTVNNTGALGSVVSIPIINQPQAGILAMEAIVKRPVVIDDAIAIRSMMYLCLSFDHRLVDGATATGFISRVKRWLEAFGPQVPMY